MKIKTLFLTVIAAFLAVSFCAKAEQRKEVRLDGIVFSQLEIGTAVNVSLVPDERTYIEVIGSDEDLKYTRTEYKDDEVKIYLRNPDRTKRSIDTNNYKGRVVVHYSRTIDEIEAHSAAALSNTGHKLNAGKLSIEVSSAAAVNLDIDCKTLDLDASSAAQITLSGVALRAEVDASSAANVNLENLKTGYAEVDASSSAVVKVAAENLELEASTGASIIYQGDATILKLETSTGGRIRKK